jgi:hypothetical protein
MPIRLASNLELPDEDAATQTYGFIGRKSSGKTYAAGKLVEGLFLIGAPVIVFDPVGNWYGLRLSANGKSAGLSIPVFGGLHGDVPLEPAAGELLGKLLVERNMSAVVDVSAFTQGEMKRFVADFAETLYHHAKNHRVPRMIVLEEAQLFAPQMAKGQERMLGAIERIVRLGRNFGLGSCMISQRPQSINKEVLNQVECLFVGQLNAVHERKAIEAWVLGHGVEKSWTDRLPELQQGNMMVWSPQWLGVMKQVKISRKITFDASATPRLGAKPVKPTELHGEFDIAELTAALAPPPKVIPGKKEPLALAMYEEAQDLERRLKAALEASVQERAVLVEALKLIAGGLGTILQSMQQLEKKVLAHPALALGPGGFTASDYLTQPKDPGGYWIAHSGGIEVTRPDGAKNFYLNEQQELPPITRSTLNKARRETKTSTQPSGDWITSSPAQDLVKTVREARHGPDAELKGGARRMLTLLAAFYPGKMSKAQIARAAGMTPSGGAFSKYWAQLNGKGLMQRVGQDDYVATDKALQVLGHDRLVVPATEEGRIEFWEQRLKGAEVVVLRAVVDAAGGLTRDELAERVRMTASGGAFNGYLGTLRRNRLITKDGDLLRIHPWLQGKE